MRLTRIKNLALWALLSGALASTVWYSVEWYRLQRENEWIKQLNSGHSIPVGKVMSAHPELRLARAAYLKSKHRYDEALETLNLIIDRGDKHLQTRVRYNLGNLYLQQAVSHVETMAMNEALPLAGLAKHAYRQALTLDSQFWDAKYNLEVAMRLLPEMDRINTKEEPPQSKKSQLWTTVPGFPRGLP